MALTTTVGGTSSDSYVSLSEFTEYCNNLGLDHSGTSESREQALRAGTQYLDNRYRQVWKGFRANRDQSLAWPRAGDGSGHPNYLTASFAAGVIDQDGYEIPTTIIPQQIKDATCEAAVLRLAGVSLQPTLERGGRIKREKVKSGSAEVETEYMDGASARSTFAAIDGLISGLVTSLPGSSFQTAQILRG